MAFVIKDRVKEGTTTTGTGAVSLGGATATFDAFTDYMSNGDTTHYAIVHTSSGTDEWEVGVGTWNTGNTLTRTTVLASSNSGSAVNFSAGNKDVFMTQPASATALLDTDSQDLVSTITFGNHDTDDLAEGSTNQYYTDARAQAAISVTDSGGDGSLTKSGGTITYTGPSASETRAHFSGGTGVTITDGSVAIGQAVGTSSDVTFNSVTLGADPTAALGAATKQYVDTIAAAGIHYHDPVRVEHPGNLPATYDNGTNGVGATLTNNSTQAALVIDGVTMALNDRVLIYEQTNAAHNGIYTVTNVGSSSTNWVLTRATDADSYGASDEDALGEGDAFFVKEGTTGAGELYVMNTSGTITFGTTNITFTVIAETAVYSAGTGLTLTGTTFAAAQDISTTASPTFAGVTAPLTGNVTGNVTGDVTGDVTGNADTATALATARTIAGQSFDGSANISIAPTDLTGVTATAAELNVLDGITATTTELNYMDGVTSNVQTQIDNKKDAPTITVTVSGGKFLLDGTSQQTALLGKSLIYRFDQSDSSNASHPLKFSTTSDGTHNSGTALSTGVTSVGTPGSAGAYTEIKLEQDQADTIYYYCSNHSVMGGKVYSGEDFSTLTATISELNILDGVTATASELNTMDGITATTAELNKLDGFTGVAADLNYAKDLRATGVTTAEFDKLDGLTATAAELNIMDGVTATTTEINKLDGVTATTAELNKVDGLTATTTELNYVDGVTSNIQTQLDARLSKSGGTMTGGLRHDQNTLSASGGTLAIDLSAANNFLINISANTTFSFSNKDAGRFGNIVIKQNATGGYSFTLPSECKTPVNGASITQSTGANEISVLSYYVLDGSNILVNYIGDFA